MVKAGANILRSGAWRNSRWPFAGDCRYGAAVATNFKSAVTIALSCAAVNTFECLSSNATATLCLCPCLPEELATPRRLTKQTLQALDSDITNASCNCCKNFGASCGCHQPLSVLTVIASTVMPLLTLGAHPTAWQHLGRTGAAAPLLPPVAGGMVAACNFQDVVQLQAQGSSGCIRDFLQLIIVHKGGPTAVQLAAGFGEQLSSPLG